VLGAHDINANGSWFNAESIGVHKQSVRQQHKLRGVSGHFLSYIYALAYILGAALWKI
jgi:hypothetical protein